MPTVTDTITLYEVGGCVRDRLLGVTSKDVDYAVEAPSFTAMREFLLNHGVSIFLETPEFLTIRGRFPKTVPEDLLSRVAPQEQLARLTVDFVLCRAEGEYTDGRHPDEVRPGTIAEDLARRDFTVNAIARRADGTLLDPHDGEADLATRTLRCVGNAADRLAEDSLRALRAIRFAVTKGFTPDAELTTALRADWMPQALAGVSTERRREELARAFRHDTLGTLRALAAVGEPFTTAALADGIWLKPTLEQ